jgi:hypothetical protein
LKTFDNPSFFKLLLGGLLLSWFPLRRRRGFRDGRDKEKEGGAEDRHL